MTSIASERLCEGGCGRVAPVVEIMGQRIPLKFCAECGTRAVIEEERVARERSTYDALVRAGVTTRLTDQTLDSSPVAASTIEICRSWIRSYGDGERRNLWISGDVGVGKSGLAWGIVRELALDAVERYYTSDEEFRGNHVFVPCFYLNWRDLLADLREEMRASGDGYASEVYDRAQRVPVLALDDLGSERPTSWALEALAVLVQARYDRMAPTIVTSNYQSPELAERLGDDPVVGRRIVTRLVEDAISCPVAGENLRRRG